MALPQLNLGWHLEQLLSGEVDPKDADPRILMWAEFMIWQAADEILRMPDKAGRRKALDKIPETIRPFVEREAKKLFTRRREGGMT
jgi:hypothetical protein